MEAEVLGCQAADAETQYGEPIEIASKAPTHYGVPPEILAHIFHFCLPADFTIQIPQRYPPSHRQVYKVMDLLKLCHVSLEWRRVALGEPRLWNRIELHGLESPKDLPFLDAVMEQSKPESVLLVMHQGQSLDVVLPFLSANSARFYWMELEGKPKDVARFFALPGTFSALESLTVCPDDLSEDRRSTWHIPEGGLRILEGSSRLRRIQFLSSSWVTPIPLSPSQVRCSQLTKLLVCAILPSTALEFMRQAENLVKCAFHLAREAEFCHLEPSSSNLLLHTCLEEFTLFSNDQQVGRAFLRHLKLPCLLKLDVNNISTNPPMHPSDGAAELIAFLEQSSPSLTHLEYDYTGDPDPILERVQHSLTHLDISSFLRPATMTRIVKDNWFQHLRKMECHVAFQDLDSLLTMLKALWSRIVDAEVSSRNQTDTERTKWELTFHVSLDESDHNHGDREDALQEFRRRVMELVDRMGVKATVQVTEIE